MSLYMGSYAAVGWCEHDRRGRQGVAREYGCLCDDRHLIISCVASGARMISDRVVSVKKYFVFAKRQARFLSVNLRRQTFCAVVTWI